MSRATTCATSSTFLGKRRLLCQWISVLFHESVFVHICVFLFSAYREIKWLMSLLEDNYDVRTVNGSLYQSQTACVHVICRAYLHFVMKDENLDA